MNTVDLPEIDSWINSDDATNNLQEMTQEKVKEITQLKTRILEEVTKTGFPDLAFLYSEEVLSIIPSILEDLLEEDRRYFYEILEKNVEDVTFADIHTPDILGYLFGLVSHLDGVNKSEVTEQIIENFEPKYIAYSNEQLYNKKFYEIHISLSKDTNADSEQKRIMDKSIKSFEINGINLSDEKQERIQAINLRLSKLSNDFSNNIVKSKKEFSYHISDFDVIKNLPQATLDIARSKAEKERKEWYLFDADPTAYGDILDYCSDPKVREDFAKAKSSFASYGEFDNRPIVLEILQLKEEKAKVLGYENFAELSLAKKMADSPEVVFDLIWWISEKAKSKAYTDIEEIKSYFHLNTLEYWDISYYETKLKEEKYTFDEKELKKYFEYNNVITYLFEHARNFYGITMKQVSIPVYNDDVSVYEVYKNGELISYYFLDAFYSDTKTPGAWANNPRWRDIVNGVEKKPVVLNVCNFQKSKSWETLLSMRDVETLFHEFGHALHEMLSESKYSELSGFNVEWDFVELPSQINENWVNDRESLSKLAKHYQTGESIPTETLDTLDTLKTFMSGVSVLGQNTYALLDMNLYSSKVPSSIEELDTMILDFINGMTIFPKWPEFKMYTSFGHIFSGWYSAWYYSYMWAEILEADVFARIKELWMFDQEVGEKFIQTILWQGTKKPANELFFDFMWRDLDNTAFMARKGLI